MKYLFLLLPLLWFGFTAEDPFRLVKEGDIEKLKSFKDLPEVRDFEVASLLHYASELGRASLPIKLSVRFWIRGLKFSGL